MREGRRDWFAFSNQTGDVARIDLYDEIGFFGVTAAEFGAALRQVTAPVIDLHINSPGGEVFDGLAIYNALRQHEARVEVTVDGIAASAASTIAMAGDVVRMATGSLVMIHEVFGLVIGSSEDLRREADVLDKLSENTASIYQERAGGTVEAWREAMRAETWYTAEEAVEAGLADEVFPVKAQRNHFQKAATIFRNFPNGATGERKTTAGSTMLATGSWTTEVTVAETRDDGGHEAEADWSREARLKIAGAELEVANVYAH